jgi:two-component system, NtrC family, sensor kinase
MRRTDRDAEPAGRRAPPDESASELGRLRADAAFHQRFGDLTIAFSRAVSSVAGLSRALKTLVVDANVLLGARRTSVWLHQRRSHDLVLAACSDDDAGGLAGRVRTDELDAPAALGLRLDRPRLVPDGDVPLLLAPLRGRRRALGTLVVEGPFTSELEGSRLLDFTTELARQLSAAIENIQLLEEILRQRRLLENTFDSLVDLVVVTDAAWRIVQMNDAFIARVGRSRADLLERPLEALVGAELAAWAAAPESGDAGTGPQAARHGRFDDPRLGGIFAVTMTSFLQEEAASAGHVLVARDITHQTRLEQERDAWRERLAQTQKLASLGQFVAGIAHEMNNPLQGVLGHLELMIETSEAARPLRRELRGIYQDADRAAKIVRNLMVFTGSRRMARRRLRLPRLLSRVLGSRAPALRRAGIEVARHEGPDLPQVIGDPLLLHQAFLNIVINAEHAIRSSGGTGQIEVRSWFQPERCQVITSVRDTGAGIPPEILPRIFDPFFTTKDVGQGTGLGLAITYGIVSEHGGTIHAANASDAGAIITVELPAATSSRRVPGAAERP